VESGGTRTYYYCQNDRKGADYAYEITPGTESDAVTTDRCWIAATNFDFIATKVLLARNAFIDVFSGNAAYMYDSTQSWIVAGMQGGDGLNFFAGTKYTESGSINNVLPANAPFRVYASGQVNASNLNISGGSVIVNGTAGTSPLSQVDSIVTDNGIRAKHASFVLENPSSGGYHRYVYINDLTFQEPAVQIYSPESITGGALEVNGDVSFANGEVHMRNEYGTSSPTIKHIVVCNHGAVPQPGDSGYDANTLYLEKSS